MATTALPTIQERLRRTSKRQRIGRKFNDNLEFKEMSKAVSKDGIFILFLIRLSSFPFAVLNAYFGAMTQLPYWKFILATTLSTPHLFLPIFIGHNISSLADPDITGKDRILKWVGNILGIIFTLAAAWYIYRHTTRRIQRINAGLAAEDGEEEDELEAAARAMHQQQQRPRQQYSLPPYDSSMDLTNERQWDKNERESTYDTAVSMEELESLRRRGSGEGQSAETIAVVDDLGDADRRKNRL
ncbi:Tlg2-vesicle protein [Dissophora ornata]|nr:Tlg2-vesicle protein [Dissophora ornata]